MEFHLIDFIEHVLNVLVLFLLLRTFLYKPVHKFMADREAKFAHERGEIDAGRKEADTLKTQYESSLANAKAAAEKIAEEKRAALEREADDVRKRAAQDAQQILANAHTQAEAERNESLKELRSQVADLAVGLAGRILEREVSKKDNQKLIDDFFKKVDG